MSMITVLFFTVACFLCFIDVYSEWTWLDFVHYDGI